MKKSSTLSTTAVVEYKHEGLPRFVCIRGDKVAPWKLVPVLAQIRVTRENPRLI